MILENYFSRLCYCYYQIFRYCQIPVSEWFRRYVSLVYILSIIGIVQFVIMSATQIDIFPYTLDGTMTQNTGRLHAMLMEPGSFTAFSIPAAAYDRFNTDIDHQYDCCSCDYPIS